jgi:hypothetical protein
LPSASSGGKFINCSFQNIQGISPLSSPILFTHTPPDVLGAFNIEHCVFERISYSTGKAAIFYLVNSSGDYTFSNNSFINVSGANAVLYLDSSSSTFLFSFNSFTNVSSSGCGGV